MPKESPGDGMTLVLLSLLPADVVTLPHSRLGLLRACLGCGGQVQYPAPAPASLPPFLPLLPAVER